MNGGHVETSFGEWSSCARRARMAAGLSQVTLAHEVGCQQSAISMMERGRRGALAQETLVAIARRLAVDPPPGAAQPEAAIAGTEFGAAFCPAYDCPSNIPVVVRGEVLLLPCGGLRAAGQGPHCRYCGEILESVCPRPECGRPVGRGACCTHCGSAYVPGPGDAVGDPVRWAEVQRRQLMELARLMDR